MSTPDNAQREMIEGKEGKAASGNSLAVAKAQEEGVTLAQARMLLKVALDTKKPSDQQLADLRIALRAHPQMWRETGNLAERAREKILDTVTNGPVVQQIVLAAIDGMKAELGYAEAPRLEKLLIDQITVCWLNLYTTQQSHAAHTGGSHTLTVGAYWERRLTASQNRFLQSVEALAKVRKLSRADPSYTLMLNIAKQQINASLGGPGR